MKKVVPHVLVEASASGRPQEPPSPDHRVSWVEHNNAAINRYKAKKKGFVKRPETLSPFQGEAVCLMADGFGTGVYNLSVNWETVDWDFGRGVCFVVSHRGLATWDFNHLTRLVIGAHDRCIRLDIDARARNYLALMMWPRKREGSMSERHPTIEQAIASFRGQTTLDATRTALNADRKSRESS